MLHLPILMVKTKMVKIRKNKYQRGGWKPIVISSCLHSFKVLGQNPGLYQGAAWDGGEEGEEGPGVCSLRGHLMELLLRVSTLDTGLAKSWALTARSATGQAGGQGLWSWTEVQTPVQPLAVTRTSYQPLPLRASVLLFAEWKRELP